MADNRETRQQELARLLLHKAHQDLFLVQSVGGTDEIADEIIGFHVQQVVEKVFKAVLTRFGIQYEYTHDLLLLYQQVEKIGIDPPAALDDVGYLTIFAVQFRYTLYEEASFDRSAGIGLAEEFYRWAEKIIELPINPDQKS